MQIANVVYVAGAADLPPELEIESELERQGLPPKWSVAVSATQGWSTPERAALELMQRGAHRIELRTARWLPGEGLTLGTDSSRYIG